MENWIVAKDKRIWGLARKAKTCEQLKIGDYIVFYVKRETSDSGIIRPKITGIFRISSKPFYDEKKLFAAPVKTRELYPWRFKIEPITIPKEPLEFDKLVPKLEFIERKKVWYTYLQHAIKRLSESDFKVINSSIGQ